MKRFSVVVFLCFIGNIALAGTKVEPKTALSMLTSQNAQFKQKVVMVAPNVYTAVGYHGANTSMIIGTDGVIIVDTLMGPESARNAFTALRQYSDKPVKAIIYTHSHDDHIGGARAFMGDESVDIYAMDNFSTKGGADSNLRSILLSRGMRQFARNLPEAEATNRGLAPAHTIDHDRGKGYIPPTKMIEGDTLELNIAGIEIEFCH